MKDNLQEELDKAKLFVVRYGMLIKLTTLLIIIALLATLKINNISILELGIKYYFK